MVQLGDYGQGASQPPPIYEAWNSNAMTLVAEGATPPADVQNGVPGQPNVHDFEVNLGHPKVDVIPKTNDLVLVFSFYSILNGQKVSTHSWRLWAGDLFPAKFSLPVKNPLDVELVIPQFIHDKLLVHSVISSAFGSYDVDVGSAQLSITDPSNQPVLPTMISRVGDYQVAHGAHFKPVNITWIWDYKSEHGLKPGTYKTSVTACNQQHSACETTAGSFTLGSDLSGIDVQVGHAGQITASQSQIHDLTSGGQAQTQALPLQQAQVQDKAKAVPGLEPFALIAALGAACILRRRWTE
jgi:hypothetical protein